MGCHHKKGLELRNSLAEITGFGDDSRSQALSKGFGAMSQDTADQLNGRFAALQISNESISVSVVGILAQMSTMTALTSQSNAFLDDILVQHSVSNNYLSEIAKHIKLTYAELSGRIQVITEHVRNL